MRKPFFLTFFSPFLSTPLFPHITRLLFPPLVKTWRQKNKSLLRRFITFPYGDIDQKLSKLLSHFSCGRYRRIVNHQRSLETPENCVWKISTISCLSIVSQMTEKSVQLRVICLTAHFKSFFPCLCTQAYDPTRTVEIDIWNCWANNHRTNLHFCSELKPFLCVQCRQTL